MLDKDFIKYTQTLFGEERWQRYLSAFDEETPVSIRINPFKVQQQDAETLPVLGNVASRVPWCRNAFYLQSRPNFTHDPLFHAGAYYVQEASSMFLDHVMQSLMSGDNPFVNGDIERALDLCAAPGGKSTLLRAALPDGCVLYSNEPDRRRANILMENMQKQGHPNVVVTNNLPHDYQSQGLLFDLILTDVPCSGEGMFRKDEATMGEWSTANVMRCQELQRSIVQDIWQCLKPGGVLIYSTCTFNLREDEENVKWIMQELGAEIIPVSVEPEWNITGSLLDGWHKPVYRFIPGTAKGEGLFMAVLRKTGDDVVPSSSKKSQSKKGTRGLNILSDGNPQGIVKGKNVIPAHAEALLINLPQGKYPQAELTLDDALRYLHHEAIVLDADAPRGYVIVTYRGMPLGFVKNIGNRANNLYPQEWKIRNL